MPRFFPSKEYKSIVAIHSHTDNRDMHHLYIYDITQDIPMYRQRRHSKMATADDLWTEDYTRRSENIFGKAMAHGGGAAESESTAAHYHHDHQISSRGTHALIDTCLLPLHACSRPPTQTVDSKSLVSGLSMPLDQHLVFLRLDMEMHKYGCIIMMIFVDVIG